MSNPSTVRIGVTASGNVVLHQGAVDAGQGSNTVIPQIAADALGIPVHALQVLGASTHQTPDCGRTSASRQTFVTGRAAQNAAIALRNKITSALGVAPETLLAFVDGQIRVEDGSTFRPMTLAAVPVDAFGYVFCAEERFDPPTTGLDSSGQGSPYAVYAFGVQLAEVEVDGETGDVRVVNFVAAHDVGRAVNPTLLAGQVEGAVAQGIGMALMERFVPARTNNFHDYLIPTTEDMPPVKTIFIEDPATVGPFGAKGIGEPALVPTAAAILNAIYNATGVRIHKTPALPSEIRQALSIERRMLNSAMTA
jgi:CO/xanthine dehydrogenase Mo-binding subunit